MLKTRRCVNINVNLEKSKREREGGLTRGGKNEAGLSIDDVILNLSRFLTTDRLEPHAASRSLSCLFVATHEQASHITQYWQCHGEGEVV